MKREDVLKVFPNATDEEIDSILNQIGSELNPLKKELKEATTSRDDAQAKLTTAQAENENYKQQVEDLSAKVQEGMSVEEKLEAMQKETEATKRDFLMKSNALEAKTILIDGGIPSEHCDALLEQVVSEDTEKTKSLAESIVNVAKAQKEATEKETKEALLKGNPKLGGAGGAENSLTKEEFGKMSYEEQAAALKENPELLQSFNTKPSIQHI